MSKLWDLMYYCVVSAAWWAFMLMAVGVGGMIYSSWLHGLGVSIAEIWVAPAIIVGIILFVMNEYPRRNKISKPKERSEFYGF